MNHKNVYSKVVKLLEAYIDEYRRGVDGTDDELLSQLRSWSDHNGIRAYINSFDLLPEFRLDDAPYAIVEVLGLEVNIAGGRLNKASVNLLDGDDYGLVDVEALLDHAIENISSKPDVKLRDFFVENTVKVDRGVSAGSIRQRTELEVKSQILDSLLERRSVNFDN